MARALNPPCPLPLVARPPSLRSFVQDPQSPKTILSDDVLLQLTGGQASFSGPASGAWLLQPWCAHAGPTCDTVLQGLALPSTSAITS